MGAAATREKRDDVDPTAEPDRGGVDKSEKPRVDSPKLAELRTLKGHSSSVRRAASTVNYVDVFPDGRRVVSASGDWTLKVWDVATGKCVATLEGHSDGVRGVAVFPDGRRVVSGSEDNTLKYWGLPK